MQLLVLITTAALLSTCRCSNVNRHLRILDLDNSIAPTVLSKQKNKLRLTQWPPAVVELGTGATAELVCEATGAPAPTVHWYSNDEPVYEHETEVSEGFRHHPSADTIGRVVSKLIVTRAAAGDHYTCLVTSLALTARATTTVYSTDGSAGFTERNRLAPLAPRIVFYYRVFMDPMDKDIVLPCRAKGHPRPNISWLDTNGTVVENHPRMKVLRSGDLVISRARWTDMGCYTCKATNLFGADSVSIFLYPAKAS